MRTAAFDEENDAIEVRLFEGEVTEFDLDSWKQPVIELIDLHDAMKKLLKETETHALDLIREKQPELDSLIQMLEVHGILAIDEVKCAWAIIQPEP